MLQKHTLLICQTPPDMLTGSIPETGTGVTGDNIYLNLKEIHSTIDWSLYRH